ncbi:ATP-binding protein [Glaciecola sp. MF2-115]|uniref:ATP-binding protein n=1 Tax=Glaciecola sp. MF2-115 TaxID=3384827 RepID=UPI00399F3696
MTDNIFEKKYLREKQARRSAERYLEEKSLELYQRNLELEFLKENLEEQVEARTKEARAATETANLANQAKSQFLANMSHEIRTPLTAIIGFAELVLRENLTEETKKHLTTIINNGRHLTELLGEILDIGKIEAQNLVLEERRFDLSLLLAEQRNLHLESANSKSLELNIDVSSGMPQWIVGDPTRIRQILQNLLSNAIKFTSEGKVDFSIKTHWQTSEIEFKVTDTGMGISDEQQKRIFDNFKQADDSINRKFGGTGLGLGIAKNLCKLMGGQLSVVSQLDQGSTFTVRITCSEMKGILHQLPNKTALQQAYIKPIPKLHGRILLAEDTQVNQELITYHVEMTGAELVLAENGQQAIQKAISEEFDLVLLDIQMPVLDGKEVIKALKQIGYRKPIYALTANVMQSDVTEYRALGFEETLAKPLDLAKFFEVLQKHLPEAGNQNLESEAERAYEERLKELKPMFIASLVQHLNEINNAISNNDMLKVGNILHVVKGIGGSFGNDRLSDLANEVMVKIRLNQYETAKPMLEELLINIENIIKQEAGDE